MARPWRFDDDDRRSQSPFNRPPPTQAGPPPSFQTNINRTKTRKWTEAKQYNYDGDDWGDVDPYDEYGSYPEPSQAAQPTQAMHQRQQSFDRGDERRVFSAGAGPTPGPSRDYPPPQQQQYGRGDGMNAQMGQGQQARGGRRDFSQPSQVPQPLHAQQSPAAIRPSSAGVAFPPRKSSMGPTETQAQGPAPTQPSVAPAMGTDKPLPANVPFIRPSDIYKRMQEAQEKERQSMDSSRPSMDSLQRPGSSGGEQNWLPANVTEMSQQTGRGQSLGTVVEGAESAQNQAWSHDTPQRNQSLPQAVEQDHHSIYELSATPKKMPMADQSLENTPERVPLQTSLPRVSRIASGFGDDFWSSTGLGADTQTNSEAPTAETWRDGMMKPAAPSESPQAEELLPATSYNPPPGLQTVVSQAFDRTDDNFTPISQSNSQTLGSEISRSNTDSTAGISPIMSRVPSAATAESRQRANEHHEPTVTPIAEETLREISTPGHSRNASNDTTGPTHRQEMYAPSPKGSPARAPVLANTRRLSHPMTAEVGHVDEQHEQIPIGPDYAEREVDLAQQATSHNQAGSPELIAAASDARAGFLQTHAFPEPSSPQANTRSFPRNTATLTSPTVTSPTISGRESPAAGRVRDLAGRFNEIQDASRRNSQTSLSSKASLSSWKQGDEGLALRKTRTLESPVMESSGTFGQSKDDLRPQLAPQASFRPHLPGEWVSTTNLNVQTPPAAPSPTLSSHSDTPKAPMTATERTEQVDFTPTTARRSLRQAGPQDAMEDSHSPIDALKAAGAALAASLMGSAGTVHHESRDFAQPAAPSEEDMEAGRAPPRRSGDVHMRPLISDMLDMSVASSIAPTPAANYGLGSELPERSSTYFPRVEEPSSHRVPGSSEDEDDYDYDYDDEEMESDRLRREIERSLTPQPPRAQHDEESEDEWERDDEELRDQVDRDQQALDAPQHLEQHQRAENIPVEEIVPAMPHQHEQQIVVPTIHGPEHDSRPGMLDQRFSWEERKNRDSTTAMFNPAALGPELDRPRTPLHVVNANVSEESLTSPAVEHVPEPAPVVEMDPDNLSSPVEQMRELEPVAIPNEATSTQPDSHRDQVPREHEEEETTTTSPPHSPVLASPRSNDQKALPISPGELGQEQREHARPATATTVDGQPRIVPFREILAIRDASTRIEAYQNTRQQFADMDTGLRSWLSTTIAAHPEHAHIATDSPNLLSSTASIRHKPAPSIMKIAKGLGGSRADEAQSVASPTKSTDPSSPQQNNAYGVNVDKMSSKGKDLLQTAGKLGGKGMTGAKGWLAKGRQKLRESGSGVDKAQGTPSTLARDGHISMLVPTPPASSIRAPSPAESIAASASSLSRLPSKKGESRTSSRFSMAFDRMRTTSENSSSYSRPQSVVVTESRDKVPKIAAEHLPLPQDNGQSFPKTLPHTAVANTAATAGLSDWRSPWDEDVVTPDDEGPVHNGVWRLGVLPSPGVETFESVGSDATMSGTKQELQTTGIEATGPIGSGLYSTTPEGVQSSDRAPEAHADDSMHKADTPMILADESWAENDGHIKGHRRAQPSDVSQLRPMQHGEASRTSSVSSMHEHDPSPVGQITTQGPTELRRSLEATASPYASTELPDQVPADRHELSVPYQNMQIDHNRRFDVDSPTVPDFIRLAQPMNLDASRTPLVYAGTPPVGNERHISGGTTILPESRHLASSQDPDTSRNDKYATRLPIDHDHNFHEEPAFDPGSTNFGQVQHLDDSRGLTPHDPSWTTPQSYGQMDPYPQELDTPFYGGAAASVPAFLATDPYAVPSAPAMNYMQQNASNAQLPQAQSAVAEGHRPALAEHRKRRSSVWGSFGRSLSRSSIQRFNEDRPAAEQQTDYRPTGEKKNREVANKNNVLRKMQPPPVERSSSTATQSDGKKKKRFSGFGSIFGRSRSSANAPEKPRNRLSKLAPPSQGSASADSNVHAARNQEYAAVPQPERNYLMEDTSHHPSMTPASRRNSDYTRHSTSRPVSGVWTEEPIGQPTLPNIPSTRRLHSERATSQNRFSIPNAPDLYQPLDSSFHGRTASAGQSRGAPVYEQSIPPQVRTNSGTQAYGTHPVYDQNNVDMRSDRPYDSRPQFHQRLASTPSAVRGDTTSHQQPAMPMQNYNYDEPLRYNHNQGNYGKDPQNYTHQGPPAAHFSRPNSNRTSQEQPDGYSQQNSQHYDVNGPSFYARDPSTRPMTYQAPYENSSKMHHRSLSREEAERHNLRVRQQIRQHTQGAHPAQYYPQQTQHQSSRVGTNDSGYNHADDGRGDGGQYTQHRPGQQTPRGDRTDAERPDMNSTAYPGQEWTSMGVEEGRYQWE